jgi:hypothetical protein
VYPNEGGQKHLVRDIKGQWGSRQKDGNRKLRSVDDKTIPILLPEYSEINKRVRK